MITKLVQLHKKKWFIWRQVDVKEYTGYALPDLDKLLRSVSERFNINGQNIYAKLSGVRFAETIDVKIFEFTFGEQLSSGTVHFGMVAISKAFDTLEAASCLYTLEFEVARVLVTKKRKKRILGVNAGTDRRSWYETKSLGFVTQRAMVNFCRFKGIDVCFSNTLYTNVIFAYVINVICNLSLHMKCLTINITYGLKNEKITRILCIDTRMSGNTQGSINYDFSTGRVPKEKHRVQYERCGRYRRRHWISRKCYPEKWKWFPVCRSASNLKFQFDLQRFLYFTVNIIIILAPLPYCTRL